MHLLDDRQYRSHEACSKRPAGGGSNVVDAAECAALADPARTMLGAEQEAWLDAALAGTRSGWNVIAQQTLMAQLDRQPGAGKRVWTDGWDGDPAARRRLLDSIAARRPANPVVIGGDVHAHWVADLKPDFDDPHSPVVASEFCGTSITSQGPSQNFVQAGTRREPAPQVRPRRQARLCARRDHAEAVARGPARDGIGADCGRRLPAPLPASSSKTAGRVRRRPRGASAASGPARSPSGGHLRQPSPAG